MSCKLQPSGFKWNATLAEQARQLGISVAALKRRLADKAASERLAEAVHALEKRSAGWNPRAGARQKTAAIRGKASNV